MNDPLLLLGHGSAKDANAGQAIRDHAASIRRTAPSRHVGAGFWKESPSFGDCLAACPPGPVTVVPMFMAEGYYTDEVLPREFGPAREAGRSIRITAPIGAHPRMMDAILARAREAGATPADAVVVLGHGTPRNPRSGDTAYAQAERIRDAGEFAEVATVFLDQEPSMLRVFEFVRAERAVIVPFFVADGWHAGQTIPAELRALEEAHRLVYARAAGTHSIVTEIILELSGGTGTHG